MNSLVDKTIKFIFSKKKQILFALFALICIILDKESSSVLGYFLTGVKKFLVTPCGARNYFFIYLKYKILKVIR